MRSRISLLGLLVVILGACGAEDVPFSWGDGAKGETKYSDYDYGRDLATDHPLAQFAFHNFKQSNQGEAAYLIASLYDTNTVHLCTKSSDDCRYVQLDGVAVDPLSIDEFGRPEFNGAINAALWHSAVGHVNGFAHLPVVFRQAHETTRKELIGFVRKPVGRGVYRGQSEEHIASIDSCRSHAGHTKPIVAAELDGKANYFLCMEMKISYRSFVTNVLNEVVPSADTKTLRFVYLLEFQNSYDTIPTSGIWLSPSEAPEEFLYPNLFTVQTSNSMSR